MKRHRLDWDDRGVHLDEAGVAIWSVYWSEVKRVGWVTEDTGIAIMDDHFMALWDGSFVYLLNLGCQGAERVFEEIERRFPPKYGPRGCLANVVTNDSVVVWPPVEAERNFIELCCSDLGKDSVPTTYALSEPEES